MKKTLIITTLALGFTSGAFAASVLDDATIAKSGDEIVKGGLVQNTQYSTPVVNSQNKVYQQMTVTAVFDWSAVCDAMANRDAGLANFVQLLHGSSKDITFAFTKGAVAEDAPEGTPAPITFNIATGGDSWIEGSSITSTSDYLYNDKLTLTITLDGYGGVTLYALKNNGTLEEIDDNTGLKWGVAPTTSENGAPYNSVWVCGDDDKIKDSLEGFYAYNSVKSETEILAISKAAVGYTAAAIPEPTTATLSLLALAGLAARRRK